MYPSFLPALVCCLAVVIATATASMGTISPSGAVFIGEDGIDISGTGVTAGSTIVWYGMGGTIGSAPSATVFVTDPSAFYVSPGLFQGKTGSWFTEQGITPVFYVQEPQISLRIFDETADFEITPSTVWVPRGDAIGFQVDTTVSILAARPGSPGSPVTIRIRGPDGIEYSAVDGFLLENILIDSPNYRTGPVWFTGDYGNGNYTVWVESTGNNMNDNYPSQGKTISAPVTFLLQRTNPLIAATTAAATVTTTFPATTSSTVPQTALPTPAPTTLMPTTPGTVRSTATPASLPGFGHGAAILALAAGLIAVRIRK